MDAPRVLHRGVTVAVTVLSALCMVLALTYLILPAQDMPSIIPGARPTLGWAHRYGQATGAFLLGLFLAFAAYLRWRLHRHAAAIRRPAPVTAEDVNLYTDA